VPAFTLSAQALKAASGMEAAQASGWRVFAPFANDAAILSVMTLATPDQASEVAGIQSADRAKAAFDAMVRVTNMKELDQCQLKWLAIPSILFEGFWLHSNAADQRDLVGPVFTVDDQFQPFCTAVMKADDFLQIARGFACNRLDYSDLPVVLEQHQP
jgi:hypothetical protein